jgi:hypothetical protein
MRVLYTTKEVEYARKKERKRKRGEGRVAVKRRRGEEGKGKLDFPRANCLENVWCMRFRAQRSLSSMPWP